MASMSDREHREIEAANASGNTPVVFIHGLWLLPSSWANWSVFFKQAGYTPLTPDWPRPRHHAHVRPVQIRLDERPR